MHYYGDRYKHLYLPGSGFGTDSIPRCPPQGDGGSTTCHPLSIIKSPVPRWQSCAQPLQPGMSQTCLLPCQPFIQRCVVLCPEPCETTRLLPCETTRLLPCGKPDLKFGSVQTSQTCETTRLLPCETTRLLPCRKPDLRFGSVQTPQPCETTRPEKKRVAKSLPPCAPRCPEPGKLRFPPCGIRSSASCKGEGRCHKLSKCSWRWYSSNQPCGYSLPFGGLTECPPQPCVTRSCLLREGTGGFPQHKCTKGYPIQEGTTGYSSSSAEQRLAKCPGEPPKRPPEKGLKECAPQQKATTKCSLPQEAAKVKGSSGQQHLSRSRCLPPRATHRPGHPHSAGLKRSSHSKRSRCAAKWLW